ncbi:hypothetical protein WN944_023828 [Citrus x changshan-huyou]|uniref:Uncharacterized protein n=1 Tax=Citrus x changshan-huyou TaxID=2935761 RepID=A0AAP0QBE3_9ROSI
MVDDSTHIYVRFMGTKYKIGLVDPDTMSIIALINEVMSRACNRHIKGDEKYELSITQSWNGEVVNIYNDDDFFSQWAMPNNRGFLKLHFHLDLKDTKGDSMKILLFPSQPSS